jgi:hypothetical protein
MTSAYAVAVAQQDVSVLDSDGTTNDVAAAGNLCQMQQQRCCISLQIGLSSCMC